MHVDRTGADLKTVFRAQKKEAVSLRDDLSENLGIGSSFRV